MASVQSRAMGPVGTIARVMVAAGLYWFAFADTRGLTWFVALLGLVAFPAVLLVAQALRARISSAPLCATGPVGHAVNAAIIVGLVVIPFPPDVRDAVALFYATSMLVAAWRGYAGCEVFAIPNWLLRRDDQVGCLFFYPLDALEGRLTRRKIVNSAS